MGADIKLLHVNLKARKLLTMARLVGVFDMFDDEVGPGEVIDAGQAVVDERDELCRSDPDTAQHFVPFRRRFRLNGLLQAKIIFLFSLLSELSEVLDVCDAAFFADPSTERNEDLFINKQLIKHPEKATLLP